mgnify:CR=1 FL=1
MRYPLSPGYQAEETSLQAAIDIEPRCEALRLSVLKFLSTSEPTGADQIADAIGEHFLSVRPRLSELRDQGKVIAYDKNGRSIFGKRAIRWKLYQGLNK